MITGAQSNEWHNDSSFPKAQNYHDQIYALK